MNLERCSTYDADNLPFIDNLGEPFENAQRDGNLVLFIHFADENFAIECFTVQELEARIEALGNQDVFRLFYTGVVIDKNILADGLDAGWRLFIVVPEELRVRENGIAHIEPIDMNIFFEAERNGNVRQFVEQFLNNEDDDDGGVADVINLARNVQAARRGAIGIAALERARETIRMLEDGGGEIIPLLRQVNDNDIALINNAIQENREEELERLIDRIRRRLDDPDFLPNAIRRQAEVEDLRVRGVRAIEIVERENALLPARNFRVEENRAFINTIEEIFTEIADVGFLRWLEDEENVERMRRISEVADEILRRREIRERQMVINRELIMDVNRLMHRIVDNPNVQEYGNVMDIYNDILNLMRQNIPNEARLQEVEDQLERLLRDINFELARLRV